MGSHASRISKLEDDLIELGIQFEKSKTEGQVDYDALCSKKEYLDVLDLIKEINSKDVEQDNRLDSDKENLQQIEESMKIPLVRLDGVDRILDSIKMDL